MIIGLNEYCTELVEDKRCRILEEFHDEIISNILESDFDIDLEESVEFLEEGQNIELTKIIINSFKTAMSSVKECNKLTKAGDYSGAKKAVDNAIKELNDFKTKIRGMDYDLLSRFYGQWISFLITFVQLYIPRLISTFFTKKFFGPSLDMADQLKSGDGGNVIDKLDKYADDVVSKNKYGELKIDKKLAFTEFIKLFTDKKYAAPAFVSNIAVLYLSLSKTFKMFLAKRKAIKSGELKDKKSVKNKYLVETILIIDDIIKILKICSDQLSKKMAEK